MIALPEPKPEFETDSNMALFAEALLRNPNNAFEAAKTIFIENSHALYACQRWPDDPYVRKKQREFIKEGGEAKYLPSKSKVARQIHNVSEKVNDAELELKALKLYCDVRGFIEKPGTVINNQISSVMLVKDHGTDDDWEKKAVQQQQLLIESSG